MAVFAFTGATIVEHILGKINENRNSGYCNAAYVLTELNLKQVDFALKTSCLTKRTTISLTDGTGHYALPDDFLFFDVLKFGTLYTLEYKDWAEMTDNVAGNNLTGEGSPRFYYPYTNGLVKEISLWPVPDTTSTSDANKLIAHYVGLPAEVTNETAAFEFSIEKMMVIIDGVLAECWAKKQDPQKSMDHLRKYEAGIQNYKRAERPGDQRYKALFIKNVYLGGNA